MSTLKVVINQENGTVSVMNDGAGIPVEMHSEEKVYVPELIFGHLLTSSNYNDSEKKVQPPPCVFPLAPVFRGSAGKAQAQQSHASPPAHAERD